MGVMEKLTNAALDAFDDELKCWQRIGTWHPKHTRLVRYPIMRDLGPASYSAAIEQSVQQIELPDDQVHMFIVRAAMERRSPPSARSLADDPARVHPAPDRDRCDDRLRHRHRRHGMKPDPISTSPLAMQAYQVIKQLEPIVGTVEAQAWMQRGNELLGGITPVTAIKEQRLPDVLRAARAVAMEKGLFEEPFLPPHQRK
jgi:hypothetical protein